MLVLYDYAVRVIQCEVLCWLTDSCFFFCFASPSACVSALPHIRGKKQVLKAAQVKVAQANCIFAGLCAPQVFVYSPGMYSSSNKDFVRGTVSSFYEMFKQKLVRGSDEDAEEEDFRAFAFAVNATSGEEDMVRRPALVFFLT